MIKIKDKEVKELSASEEYQRYIDLLLKAPPEIVKIMNDMWIRIDKALNK